MEPSQGGTFQASWEYFTQESIVSGVKDHCLVKVQHMIIWIRGAVVHSKRWNEKSARRLIVQNMLAQGGRQHVIRPPDKGIKCCMQGGRCPERVLLKWKLGAMPPNRVDIYSGANSETGPISAGLSSHSALCNTNSPAGLARRSLPRFGFALF